MVKRTFQPKKKRRRRVHGFLARLRSIGGIKLLKRRRLKGRKNLSI
ncbi:50S ribosomal protein L34 [Candidatus Roizmanbacteria bacterium CG22_combo_CG10-13_8_21_14_all_38_20]|uniref:Large ribosomal subunit protein bL34 n=1 Tax=Candidatus Roizmanbacteria bacterium CG22_combo_CG10-13_8_21_14_all_38_20 TaxID=1974862 RepID=A0A2H0BTU5_9BACT|nr:50S ribosomal protein L34 [bacterium]PIP61097.1 MAG: 50S ribosomal protein L34 [Candidatus Roizmanbacteria bacterium CG22_combo_CG10-13_8_21_14_all_38_20]PJC32410.1 MAG: 50S ribosomal protein L34 [Candidatus Roizmanbacteria bacterium CG_4_9_14_0_2_um_filter_38_17]